MRCLDLQPTDGTTATESRCAALVVVAGPSAGIELGDLGIGDRGSPTKQQGDEDAQPHGWCG